MIISIKGEKAFNKINHLFKIKPLNKLVQERNYKAVKGHLKTQ